MASTTRAGFEKKANGLAPAKNGEPEIRGGGDDDQGESCSPFILRLSPPLYLYVVSFQRCRISARTGFRAFQVLARWESAKPVLWRAARGAGIDRAITT